MENRRRKRTQRKNHKIYPGNTKPCSRTVLNPPGATQSFPIWPVLSPHSAVWVLVFALPVWSQEGKIMQRHNLEKQRRGFCPGSRLCAGREVGGSGRKTKPGTSHGAQGQARAPTGSFILDFNCPATPTPKFLVQMANRANTERKAMQQGQSALPVLLPQQAGLSWATRGLLVNLTKTCSPAEPGEPRLIDMKLSGCHTLPRASLCHCSVPGSHVPCLGDTSRGVPATCMEKLGVGKPWARDIHGGWTRFLSCQKGGWAG